MSKTKTTYILRNSHLIRYRHEGKHKCERCNVDFIENDIVASTTKRKLYCYDCATLINLVTGNLDEDLNYDALLPESIDFAIRILKKINADEKNKISSGRDPTGLASTALYLACKKYNLPHTQKYISSKSEITEVL